MDEQPVFQGARSRLLAACCGGALVLAACADGELDDAREDPGSIEEEDAGDAGDADGAGNGDGAGDDGQDHDVEVEDEDSAQGAVDPAEVDANELGEVPVLMYHRLLDDGGGRMDLTPEEFLSELEYLYDNDYRPIRTDQLVAGEIDVPAGTTPVVLTFDDSTREQFGYTDDGEIDPDSAVGILLEFADQHDDFDATGSFYVLGSLFGVSDERGAEKLAHLHELGFEIGNHTLTHERLDHLDAQGVQRELAAGAENIRDAVPDAEVTTMSLPLGLWPDDRELAVRGSHDGADYEHDGILLVGSNPAPSPFHADFDGHAIPRILSKPPMTWDADDPEELMTSGYWFDVLEQRPERRYISDGDPSTISFPDDLAEGLAEEHADRANPY
jgi:peptidoglycan/xylan/chitin deacetylase (PgdA/CDA1 family)